MAIKFDCPHCGHHYRLKDDLAGKAAACKNCRNKITIPSISDNTPLPASAPQVDVEAAAVAALADAPKVEEDPSKKVIEVECKYCLRKWTEPIARAGKNTLCPNEECRQRVKIPELKPDQTADWRQTHTKGPSLAKDNQPQKLEGVQDAGEAKPLSDQTIREKLIEIEYEPRPLRFWVMVIGGPLVLLAGLGFGVWYAINSWTEGRQDKVMDTGRDEFMKSDFVKTDAKTPKDVKEEVELHKAVMDYASAEYALRHNDPKKFKDARDQYGEALTALRTGTSPTRNVMLGELTILPLAFGGTEQQARDQIRLRWTDDRDLKTPPGARVFTVHEELQNSLRLLRDTGADFDYRAHLARRLTRELVGRGQPGMVEVIPLALFNPSEQPEANAIVALELHRAKAPDPAKIAADLVKRGADLGRANPRPASAQTLFIVLKLDKAPRIVNAPTPGAVSDESRFAYTGIALLEDKPDEALALAQRDGKPEDKLRSLVLCADWMADPSRALDAALPIVNDARARPKDVKLSPYALLRLAQIAAEKGKIEQANQFADAINDEGLKTWAKAEVVRIRLAAAPTTKGDEAWFEPLPDKPEKYRAGHAWARLWFARQNARISGNRDAEVKAVNAWPVPFSLFGRAGVALGIQDREK